jgi:phage terminase large subunit
MFNYTTAIRKMRKLNARVKVIPGGTSAGKTYGIIPILIDKATKNKLEISILSESLPHLKRGAMKDFLNIMKETGRFVEKRWNKTDFIYRFGNGSYIEFFSADQPDKLRGARRDILFINEANNISWAAYQQAAIRTRKEIWIDFNPSAQFWAHDELMNDLDVEWLTLTYKDNEFLDYAIIKEIEKAKYKAFYNPEFDDQLDLFNSKNIKSNYWANWWKVYGLGQLGVLEGVIFTNYKIIDDLPEKAKYIGTGIDFGYTNDPTTIMDAYMYNGQIIWDECTYQKGLLNSDIAALLKSQGKTLYSNIVADSAEPKSIDEINTFGFSVEGVDKGADSIKFGISILQEQPFLITKRSVAAIRELRNYCWDTDKTGKSLNKPIDAFNHCIDAMRYLAMMSFANRNYEDTSQVEAAYKKALALFN